MDSSRKMKRRSFVAQTGAAVAIGAPVARARSVQSQDLGDRFRVGCLNVSSYSHLEAVWAPLINPRAGEKETPFTGMRITHCWEIDHSKAETFAEKFGCEPVRNFDDMVGKVDGIISGGYYNHPWNHILHEPYLEAGLPNLINRPFSNSLAKSKKMIETAKKHGATILVPSAHEHNNTISCAKAWATGKKILCYNATNSFDDYPTHGIHGIYLICKSLAEAGNPVVSVSYQTDVWHSPPGVMTLEHTDSEGRRFFGTLHQVSGSWGTIRIHTPEEYGGKSFDIQRGTGYPFDKTEVWAPTIWAFQKMALYGEMPQTFEQILHKNNVFLAGWRSVLENNGAPVRLDKVPEEWESPVELPNHPEDDTVSRFRKAFG
ncbi:MAG: Gfo/Idh/MocA family oxidoreductase [bacterium]